MHTSTQLKIEIRKWAEENGLWREFTEIREKMKLIGMRPTDAWFEAAKKLSPERWESVLVKDVKESFTASRSKKMYVPQEFGLKPHVKKRKKSLVEEIGESLMKNPELDGSEVKPEVKPEVKQRLKLDVKDEESVVVDDLPKGSSPTKALFGGKKVATVKVVEWVASNMQVVDVLPSDAPSSEAWGMLIWARRSPPNESQFWGSIYAKLLPSRSAIEAEQRYSDDGVRLEDTVSRLLKMKDEAETKRGVL